MVLKFFVHLIFVDKGTHEYYLTLNISQLTVCPNYAYCALLSSIMHHI